MEDRTIVAIVGIVCITAIEVANLLTYKVDSAIVSLVVGGIGTIVGYFFGKPREAAPT